MKLLDMIRDGVRHMMHGVARALNTATGGKLSPNTVTIVGLLAHLPIAWLIFNGFLVRGGVLLIVFGLFDTLDGELARLQKRDGPAGMFLDSVTDRMKEVLVYMGLAGYLIAVADPLKCNSRLASCIVQFRIPGIEATYLGVLLVAILGGSILTSYINAWGEAVMSRGGASSSVMNKVFRGGIASFDVRMALIALGLLTGTVWPMLLLVGLLVGVTILMRLYVVFRELQHVQS